MEILSGCYTSRVIAQSDKGNGIYPRGCYKPQGWVGQAGHLPWRQWPAASQQQRRSLGQGVVGAAAVAADGWLGLFAGELPPRRDLVSKGYRANWLCCIASHAGM